MVKQPKKPEATAPRSRRLFDAGFKTLAQAAACLSAIMSDLAAGRISATDANIMTGATGRWMRDHERKAKAGKQ